MTTTLIIIIITWVLCGVFGFIYWWTTEYDLTVNEIHLIIFSACMGPISLIVGYIVHKKPLNKMLKKILFKK